METEEELNPNHYTRKDVLALARVLSPNIWAHIPVGVEPHSSDYGLTDPSITFAARALMAGYRQCKM